ncbi:MAG: hypothetical protein KDE51_11640 [Anaerolineales bacterium]|nr:hypothetical protein [Anaerolineales bacterium]
MDDKERKRLEKEEAKKRKAAEKEARQLQRQKEKTARDLRREILKYARDEQFAPALAAALPLFWNDYYTLETADEMDMNEAFRFFDWFVYDYQHEDQPRLIEQFATEMQTEITVLQEELVSEWLTAPPSGVYYYDDFDGFSQQFKLRDFFSDEEMIVFSGAGTGRASQGDLIMARIVPVGERLEFSTVAAFIPQDEIEGLQARIDEAKTAAAETHPEESHEEFMRRKGSYLIVHHALAKAEEADRYPVTRLDPKRIDKAAQRAAKKVVKKVVRKRKK